MHTQSEVAHFEVFIGRWSSIGQHLAEVAAAVVALRALLAAEVDPGVATFSVASVLGPLVAVMAWLGVRS